jgi:predicted HTH transcriptional regulator
MPEITDGRIDGYPVANATLDDLDMSKLLAHIRTALASERCEGSPDRPDEFLLRYRAAVRVSDQIRPTMAGIMMFGIRPQYFFPHADVGLGHFPGTVPNTIDVFHLARHGGTLTQQIDEVEGYLWKETRRGFTVIDGPRRVEQPEYPRKAIRELTVNAIAHRDYNVIGKYTRISMFADRIEWISPGGLPPGITLDNILQEQYARNPTIAELLWQAGYVERFGIGLDTVMHELRIAGLPELKLIDSGVSFTARIYNRHAPSIQGLTPFRVKLLEYARDKGQLTIDHARMLNNQLPPRDQRSDNSLLNDIAALRNAGLLTKVGNGRNTAYVPVVLDPEID